MVANAKAASSKKTAVKKPQAKISTKEISSEKKTFKSFVKSFNSLLTDMPIIGRVVAEFVGAFLLVIGFIELSSNPLYFALVIVGIIVMLSSSVSVHLNPAVTVASWISRKTKGTHAILYVIAQLLGACAAWLVISAFVNSIAVDATSTTSTILHGATIEGNEGYLFFVELIGMFVVGLGYAAALASKKDKIVSSLSIAFSILLGSVLGLILTQTLLTEPSTTLSFLNPAAAFALNGLSFSVWPIAIYVVAPIVGATVAFGAYELIKDRTEK